MSDADSQRAKGLIALEDWDLDIDDPILRDATLKTSEITIERVANARCWAFVPIGLRRGKGVRRLGEGVNELLAIHIGEQYPVSAPAGNARRASASNASRLSSSNAGERDNASASATYLPSSASTPAAIDRAA